jgi:hypothetical protein
MLFTYVWAVIRKASPVPVKPPVVGTVTVNVPVPAGVFWIIEDVHPDVDAKLASETVCALREAARNATVVKPSGNRVNNEYPPPGVLFLNSLWIYSALMCRESQGRTPLISIICENLRLLLVFSTTSTSKSTFPRPYPHLYDLASSLFLPDFACSTLRPALLERLKLERASFTYPPAVAPQAASTYSRKSTFNKGLKET